jgi:phosphoenolpyruvate synthase/pyruvate phosphate dikinase
MVIKEAEFGDKYVKWFSQLNKDDLEFVGKKAANLGELYSKNFPVPNGFVITKKGYDYFLNETKLREKIKSILESLDYSSLEAVKEVSEKIKKLIMDSTFPDDLRKEVAEAYGDLGLSHLDLESGSASDILNTASEPIFTAVRGSSVGGEGEETQINIKGINSLVVAIKKVFSYGFSIEAIMERKDKNISFSEFFIGIIVQKMIYSDKSGFGFTTYEDKIKLEATWGFGGKDIAGVLFDKYFIVKDLNSIEKKPVKKEIALGRDSSGSTKVFKLKEGKINDCVLSEYEIKRLGDFSLKIEEVFLSPQEIGWAIEGENFFILDSKDFGGEIKQEDDVEVGEEKENNVVEETEGKEVKEVVKEEVMEDDVVEEKEEGLAPKSVYPEGTRTSSRPPIEEAGGKEVESSSELSPVSKITKTKIGLYLDSVFSSKKGEALGIKLAGLVSIGEIVSSTGKDLDYYLKNLNEYENLIYGNLNKLIGDYQEVWISLSDILDAKGLFGLHGLKYGLTHEGILKTELKAISRINFEGKLGILLPQLISMGDFEKIKRMVGDYDFEIGVILDTPASLQLIKDLCEEGVSKIVIDSVNLTQCILGTSKENKQFFNEANEAIILQLEYVLRVCKRKNVFVDLLSENFELIDSLIEKEINGVLVKPEFAENFVDKIFEIEKNHFGGTDKELRQYEVRKEEEKLPEKDVEENDLSGEGESVDETVVENNVSELNAAQIEKDIAAIEEEKKEYLGRDSENESSKDTLGIF